MKAWHGHCSLRRFGLTANSPVQSGGDEKAMTKFVRGYFIRIISVGFLAFSMGGCSGGQMTTREKGAAIGAVGGAAAGGIVGATRGSPGAGAAIGGALGLGAGALIGDYMQGQEQSETNQQQIQQNQRTIERNRQEAQRLPQQEY